MMDNKIKLPYAGSGVFFTVEELIAHFNRSKTDFIIIGASHVRLLKHKKPNSLDVWLRNHAKVIGTKKNTCQAVNSVIYRLEEFAQFSIVKRICPLSNRMCKALVFCDNDK
jgi:hypothetical protein